VRRGTTDVSEVQGASKLVRVKDTARELTVSVRMTWRLIEEGQLQVVRFGRAVRVTRSSIDEFLARGGTQR
jgi:excisionase family DNA binding protein